MRIRGWMLPLAALAAALLYLQVWRSADLGEGYAPSPEGLALPLDDAYIFMQYARQGLAGQWGHYTPFAPHSSGVSGPLYLGALAGGMALGLPGPWAAWWLAALSLGLALWAAWRLSLALFVSGPAWLLPLLLLTHAAWVASFFQGMDTGLLHALLLCNLLALAEGWGGNRRGALLLALAWARPEGALAALILGLSMPGWWRRLGALLIAASPALALWAYSGSLTPDSLRPKLLANQFPELGAHALVSLDFIFSALKDLFLGLGSAQASVGYLGGAAQGNPPAAQLPHLALALALAGLLSAWQAEPGQRPFWRGLALWWLLCLLALAWQIPLGWQRHRYLAPLLTPIALGVGALLHACLRDPRAQTRALLLIVAALWMGHGLWRWPWFLRETQGSAAAYAAHGRQAALEARALPQAGSLAGADAGLLAWYSGRDFVDLLGVTDGALGRARLQGRGALLESLLRLGERRPLLLSVQSGRADFDVTPLLALGLLKPLPGSRELYRWDWSGAEAKQRAPGMKKARLLAELDVADLVAENAAGYRPQLQAAPSLIARRRLEPQGPWAPEGGRVVLEESFQVSAPQGARLLGRALTDRPGTWRAVWQGRELSSAPQKKSGQDSYDTWELPLTPGVGRLSIRYLNQTGQGTAWASYHYWVVTP